MRAMILEIAFLKHLIKEYSLKKLFEIEEATVIVTLKPVWKRSLQFF